MRHAVGQAGDLFSISAFTATLKTRGIEASKRTIANYLGYLEDDFVIMGGDGPKTAIQVCWEFHDGNRKRELEGIRQASKALGIKDRFFLTYSHPDPVGDIPSRPVWRWLLEEETS